MTLFKVLTDSPLIDINNVGSISQALYAKAHTVYDDVEASKWQAAQVSILSLGNFAGRILIGDVCTPLTCVILTNFVPGLVSDFVHTRLRLPRAYCLCIVSTLFIISQTIAIMVSSVETLWVATLLLGFAYGSLFGSSPTIIIDWFGLGKSTFPCMTRFPSTHVSYASTLFRKLGLRLLRTHARGQLVLPHVWALPGRPCVDATRRRACLAGDACLVVDTPSFARVTLGTSMFRWEDMLLGESASDTCRVHRVPWVELVGWH